MKMKTPTLISLLVQLLMTTSIVTLAQESGVGFDLMLESNREELSNVPVYFSKTLPSWLNGTLIRNGAALFENGDREVIHLFDGFAKLASWKFFGNGTVVFSTRFIESRSYKDSMASNSIAPYLLFESVSPPFGFFDRYLCLIRGIDNMNVNVYQLWNPESKKEEFAVFSDFWILYEISLPKLSTKARVVPKIESKSRNYYILPELFNSMGFLHLMSSAHPLPEYATKNYLTYLCSVGVFPWQSNKMSLIRMNSLNRREVIAQWSVDRIPYMHSFSVTKTKAILIASPFYVNIMCMAMKVEPFDCLDWYPDKPSMLYVVDIKRKTVDKIQIPNVFTMHHVNAYEGYRGNIVMDVSSYPNPDFVRHLQLHIMRDPVKRNKFDVHARLKRITIDMTTKTAEVADIGLGPSPSIASYLDMPAINEAYRSRRYCFVYGIVIKTDNVTLSKIAIVKKDVCHGGRRDRTWYVPNQYPSEPWFVARPNAIEEDDGILMVPALEGNKRSTYLFMLDAKDLTVIDQAKVPTIIPYSLHGRFLPS